MAARLCLNIPIPVFCMGYSQGKKRIDDFMRNRMIHDI
jgi:hypothetical protein